MADLTTLSALNTRLLAILTANGTDNLTPDGWQGIPSADFTPAVGPSYLTSSEFIDACNSGYLTPNVLKTTGSAIAQQSQNPPPSAS